MASRAPERKRILAPELLPQRFKLFQPSLQHGYSVRSSVHTFVHSVGHPLHFSLGILCTGSGLSSGYLHHPTDKITKHHCRSYSHCVKALEAWRSHNDEVRWRRHTPAELALVSRDSIKCYRVQSSDYLQEKRGFPDLDQPTPRWHLALLFAACGNTFALCRRLAHDAPPSPACRRPRPLPPQALPCHISPPPSSRTTPSSFPAAPSGHSRHASTTISTR